MSDEAATADAVQGEEEERDFGRVYQVEDRFLVYPAPKERRRLLMGTITVLVLATTWYFVTLEDRTFEAARQANTTADLKAYLADYPAGKYVDDARNGIDDLFWDERRDTMDYQGYLAKYPAGRHSGSAKQALDDLAYQAKKKVATAVAFLEYLEVYPKGRHVKGANLQIQKIAVSQFNNCMNTCVTSKGEPDPKVNFAEECCVPVCGGAWAEEEGLCSQDKNEDGTFKPPPQDAPGVTPTGALPIPPPAAPIPGAPGAPGAPAPAPAPAPAGK